MRSDGVQGGQAYRNMNRQYTIEYLEDILDKLLYQIWLKDNDGKYIYINKAGAEHLGLSKKEIIGKTDYELRNHEIAEQCIETDNMLSKENNYIYNEEYINVNEQDRWFRVNKFKLNGHSSDGENIIGGIAEEISLERNIQLELENNLLGYLDENKTEDSMEFIQSIVGNLKKTLKCKDMEAFIYDAEQRKFKLYFSLNREKSRFDQDLDIHISEEVESKLSSNEWYMNRYSEIYDCIMSAQKYENNDKLKIKHIKLADKLVGIVCIFYDEDKDIISVDESFLDDIFTKISIILRQIRNKTEILSIKQKKKELENIIELGCIKTDFFANISHEFRTPINIILSIIQLLNFDSESNLSEKYRKYLNVLKQNSYRLLRMVDNTLDTAKISNDFMDVKLENYNIVSIIENITMSAAKYLEGKKRTIIFDTNEEEVILACDAEKIEKIILNLISNAVKFSEPGTHIEVMVNTDWEKGKVFISVKNEGQSIEEHVKENIFGRCIQVDDLLIRRSEGSGMGLFLARKFVEMQGGNIYLDDIEDGTQFTFYIPIKTVDGEYMYNRIFDENYIVNMCNIEFSDIYD